jgi:hypothetical protein
MQPGFYGGLRRAGAVRVHYSLRHFPDDGGSAPTAEAKDSMSDLFDEMAQRIADRVTDLVTMRVENSLEKFLRSGVKLVWSEHEAARDFFGVGVERLRAWRKRKLISASRYPKGRLRDTEEDGLGDEYFYDLAALLSFHQRYLVSAASPDVFELKQELQPLGPEIVETRRLRAVGGR